MSTKMKDPFIDGPIPPDFVARSVEAHQKKTDIGGHDLFLGQVRADSKAYGQEVEAIEFSAYKEMAIEQLHWIREESFLEFPELSCMHVHHSLGHVPAGQLCFFVFVSAPHRDQLHEALVKIVERVKNELPIFGKELLEDGQHVWKTNQDHTESWSI